MEKLNNNAVALCVGAFVGGFHLLWSALVATGVAQGVLDWIYNLHFLSNPFTVDVFDPTRALILVGFTFVVGYIGGFVFSLMWNNMIHAKRRRK